MNFGSLPLCACVCDVWSGPSESQSVLHDDVLAVPVLAFIKLLYESQSCTKQVWHEQDVGAADRLFATLDTKIRRAETEQAQPFLLVDTVGFIQGLPMELVAAFQATLDEALQADLVVRTLPLKMFQCQS